MSLYLRLAGYLILIAGVFAAGDRVGALRWQTKYEALQSADWQGQANAQRARADALDAQLRAQKAVFQGNAQVIHDLQQQRDEAVGEAKHFADAAQRMLDASARPAPADCPMPKTAGDSRASAASPASGDGRTAQLLGDAVAECRANARALNALQEEIRPQL